MNIPFYDATREYKNLKAEFDKAIADVISSGAFILGKQVNDFEEHIKTYTGANYAIGVANGSDALLMASEILGFKNAGILTPAFTFFASASCIARLGGRPIFTDVEEDTFNMDMRDAENRITKDTKGIIPVHLFLQTVDMDKCMYLAAKYKLSVLEDAAEAFGMKTLYNKKNHHAGTIGDFCVFSFFPTKTLGAYGDGGMLVTNNEEHYKLAKSYRTHGASKKYYHDYIGYNSRLDTLQAAILQVKLNNIENAIKMRAQHAEHYCQMLNDISEIKLPIIKQYNTPVNYVFSIQTQKRDKLDSYLKEKGIGTSIYYPVPLHLQKCFEYLSYKKGDFPVAEKLCQTSLSLPMFPELTNNEVDYICDTIKEFYKKQ